MRTFYTPKKSEQPKGEGWLTLYKGAHFESTQATQKDEVEALFVAKKKLIQQ